VPPNVLFIIVDDQRPDTVSAAENDDVFMPNLDELARGGSYLRPYTTVPVCTPGRAEVLSGCNSFQNGCRWFREPIDPELTLLPEAFSRAGYRTVFSGKWHQTTHPSECGFDETHRVHPDEDQSSAYADEFGWKEVGDGQTHRYEEDGEIVDGHSTELLTEPVARFLESTPEEPWFAYLGYVSPHDPCIAPPEYRELYDPDDIELPANYLPEHPFDNGEMTIRDELLEEWPRTRDAIEEHLADYYAMITHHDYHVGRLLDILEDTGQRDDTLVVFTSDHGLAKGSHGLMGKENLYEHSARVPLILNGPGVPAGERFDRGPDEILCGHYDLYPTLLELLGIDTPDSVTGESYAPALRGNTNTVRDRVFCAYRDVMRMARDDRWKFIEYPETGHAQLFDLDGDPAETSNLLAGWRSTPEPDWGYEPDPPAREIERIVDELRSDLREWQRSMDDPIVTES
jgi:arylsulfatase A-like enzyme